jgi:hypothetical protein
MYRSSSSECSKYPENPKISIPLPEKEKNTNK